MIEKTNFTQGILIYFMSCMSIWLNHKKGKKIRIRKATVQNGFIWIEDGPSQEILVYYGSIRALIYIPVAWIEDM